MTFMAVAGVWHHHWRWAAWLVAPREIMKIMKIRLVAG